MKRFVLGVFLTGVALGGGPAAVASSCVRNDPRNVLDAAPGAFIGTFESSRAAYGTEVHRFRVERVLKGRIGKVVDVVEPYPNSLSGPPTGGGRIGLLLGRRGNSWVSATCGDYPPELLIEAAGPLPAPDGRGAPAVILGSAWGKVRALSLDAEGRVLRYGFGGPRISTMSLCPGDTKIAMYGEARLAVREPVSLRLVREYRFPEIARSAIGMRSASPVLCRDADAREIVVFQTNRHEPVPTAQVVVYRNGKLIHQVRGSWMHAAFSPDRRVVWLGGGRYGHEIWRLEIATGAVRKIFDVPLAVGVVGAPDVSPDGKLLALRSFVSGGQARHMLLNVAVSPPRLQEQLVGGTGGSDPRWIDQRSFVVAQWNGPLAVYDTSFRKIGGLGRWPADIRAVERGLVWGVDRRIIYASGFPDGPVGGRSLAGRNVPAAYGGDWDPRLAGPMLVLDTVRLPRATIEPLAAVPTPAPTPSGRALKKPDTNGGGLPSAVPIAGGIALVALLAIVIRRRLA